MRNQLVLSLLVICGLLTGCQTAKDDDKTSFQKMAAWKGQNIAVAVDTLGAPNKSIEGKKGIAYVWFASREVNTALTVNKLDTANGKNVTYDPNISRFTQQAVCRLVIITTLDSTIVRYTMNGHVLACQILAKKINTAKIPAMSNDTSDTGKDEK